MQHEWSQAVSVNSGWVRSLLKGSLNMVGYGSLNMVKYDEELISKCHRVRNAWALHQVNARKRFKKPKKGSGWSWGRWVKLPWNIPANSQG